MRHFLAFFSLLLRVFGLFEGREGQVWFESRCYFPLSFILILISFLFQALASFKVVAPTGKLSCGLIWKVKAAQLVAFIKWVWVVLCSFVCFAKLTKKERKNYKSLKVIIFRVKESKYLKWTKKEKEEKLRAWMKYYFKT